MEGPAGAVAMVPFWRRFPRLQVCIFPQRNSCPRGKRKQTHAATVTLIYAYDNTRHCGVVKQ